LAKVGENINSLLHRMFTYANDGDTNFSEKYFYGNFPENFPALEKYSTISTIN